MSSIEERARVEAKKLMSEVGKLQAKVKTQNLANKAETDKLILEINRLQVAAIKDRDSDKAKLAKEETKRLFQEQLGHLNQRQQNAKEQLDRLMQAKQKYDVIEDKGAADAKDQQLQQQLLQLIQRKKEEFVQLAKEADFIRQRAKQKGIELAGETGGAAQTQAALRSASSASTTERAKAEAERLINEAKRPRGVAETAEKAEEVSKLIQEISRLQSAADQGLLNEEDTKELETRVMRIESKQRQAREQINQLTQAKIKYELALARASQEKDSEKQRRQQDEKLQTELNELIKAKEDEQNKLMEELKLIRLRAEQEAAMLKAQRDAARALVEQQQQVSGESGAPFRGNKKSLMLSIVVSALVLVLGGGGAILFLTPLGDSLLGGKPPAKPAEAPAPAKTPETDAEPPPVAEKKPAEPKKPAAPLKVYRDRLSSGEQGPVMVQLPGGKFLLGAASHLPYAEERPQTEISLQSFSISKYEVTFKEYQDFARATGRKPPDDRGWGRANRPVINVSWNDAVAYTQWLTSQSGHQYRLPSEREWEYAAKAGTDTLYWWGDKLGSNQASCAVCGSQWDNQMSAPVGSFSPNAFGLHDMIGNVMEWTVSCYHPNYQGAPSAGQVWEGGDCSRRVVRGSGYNTYENDLRMTRRLKYNPEARSDNLGFRVVRVD